MGKPIHQAPTHRGSFSLKSTWVERSKFKREKTSSVQLCKGYLRNGMWDTDRTTCDRKAPKNNDGDEDDEDGDDLHPGVDIGSQTSASEKEAQSGSHQSRRERQTKG